jgi:formyltetrahydrofolate hydrolase
VIAENCHILTLSCADRPGLVASVTRMLAESGGNINESQQYNDTESNQFFMRVVFELAPGREIGALRSTFEAFAHDHALTWTLRAVSERRKVMLWSPSSIIASAICFTATALANCRWMLSESSAITRARL